MLDIHDGLHSNSLTDINRLGHIKKPQSSTWSSSSRQGAMRPSSNFQKKPVDKKDLSKIVCYKCNKTWHYSNKCSVVVKKINILSIVGNYKTVDSLLTVSGTVNGVKLSLALDKRATASVMASRIAKKFCFKIEKSKVRVRVANNKLASVIRVTKPVLVDVQVQKRY